MSDFSIKGLDPRFYLDKIVNPPQANEAPTKEDFVQFLEKAINTVNEVQSSANAQVDKVVRGEVEDIHSAMIELQKADLSFRMMMEVRNKILDAYQELMRMPM